MRKRDLIIEFLQLITGIGKKKGKKAAPRFELGIKDLQSSALPLGHAAELENESPIADRISQGKKILLVLSNGHGEDIIALRILEALHKRKPNLRLEVLPLVGEGKAFKNAVSEGWLVKIGPSLRLPSGGFSNQSLRGLFADIAAGLFLVNLKYLQSVRSSVSHGRVLLAVGDVLPLFFAWCSGGIFGFIGTPKSDYTWTSPPRSIPSDFYHWLKGSEWDPWECALMRSSRCKMVAVRDKLTARGLRKQKVCAISLGNPMMDGFKNYQCPNSLQNFRRLLLLCGSRMPEAKNNLFRLLSAAEKIKSKKPLVILVASGSEPNLDQIESCLKILGYLTCELIDKDCGAASCWEKGLIKVLVGIGTFSVWTSFAEIGLANAGTATEQLVGLGIPCVSLPGNGPQFKYGFAIRQSRLLGGAVIPCKTSDKFAEIVSLLLRDDNLRDQIVLEGTKRMGPMGGSSALALNVLNNLV